MGGTFRMQYRYGYQRYFSLIFWQNLIPILLSSGTLVNSVNNTAVTERVKARTNLASKLDMVLLQQCLLIDIMAVHHLHNLHYHHFHLLSLVHSFILNLRGSLLSGKFFPQ